MTREELRLRQMTNQYLVTPSGRMRVVRGLCGLQAQFLTNARHGMRIRCDDYDETAAERELVKTWTVRGTVHIVDPGDLGLYVRPEVYRRNEWGEPCFWNQRPDWALTPRRQTELSEVILDALADGERTREELKAICWERGMTEAEEGSMFHPWGGGIRQLCERGFMHGVAREEKAYRLSPPFLPLLAEEAQLELARRYFTHMGPATVHDAKYFFGTTVTQVKKWLAVLPVTAAECDGKVYYYIETGASYDREPPGCVFLAGFDQLMLGYEKKESLYLPEKHLRRIFNLAGIVMPAVLLDGRVVGRWKRKNGKLHVELFDPLGTAERKRIIRAAEALWTDAAFAVVWDE